MDFADLADDLAFLDWPDVLAGLAERAQSERGRVACARLPLCASIAEASERADEVAALVAVFRRDQRWPQLAFPEVAAVLDGADKGVALGPDELRLLAEFCQSVDHARRFFAHHLPAPDAADGPAPAGRLHQRVQSLGHYDALLLRARDTFDATGEIRDSASPELTRLRRERERLAERARTQIESLVDSEEFSPYLQDRYVTLRADRFVLPVKASFKSMGLGIVHDTSRTGETVFLEPSGLVELNNRLKVTELDVRRECRRILEELAALVSAHAVALRRDLDTLTELDVLTAMARLAVACDAVPATLTREPIVRAQALRHPLLALRAQRERFAVVANDVSLGEREGARVLVVSGPNAGGKTVLLKATGLAVLFARAGLHVPAAPGVTIGFFAGVFADIGDQQSVLGDLSTFSAHLANLSRIVTAVEAAQGAPTLVLCDELMAGTNPEQGAALARALLEHLAARPCLVVTTTHYDSLKALADGDARFRNAGMEYDLDSLRPTYRLRDNQPGRSYALDIATIMGLPGSVLERARALVGQASLGLETVLRELEAREAALAQKEEELVHARDEFEARAGSEKKAAAALAARERELGLRIRQGVETAVRETREALREIVRKAREEAGARGAEVAVGEARGAVEDIERAATAALPERPALDLDKLREALAARALGVAVAPSSAHAKVARGRPGRAPAGGGEAAAAEILRTRSNSVDVRGQRADDALSMIESFLDEALLTGVDAVFIVHGHGTGALKRAIREYLALSHHVARFRGGTDVEGGDGVTVAVLRG